MLLALLAVLGGLILVLAGAEALVRGSASLALRIGLSPLVVGLTVVAFGTSAPELVVSVDAALADRGDVAVGNVVGSNISNVLLILGASALVRPLAVRARVVRVDLPVVLGASALAAGLLADGRVGRGEGLLLLGCILLYTFLTLRLASRATAPIAEAGASDLPAPAARALPSLLLVAGGLGLLVGGGHLLVEGAVEVAHRAGLSEATIGLTILAVGTSLPELATSLVAARRGEGDIAIGNVVGSNAFNLLGILGTGALVRPLALDAVGTLDLAVMVGSALLLLPLLVTGARLGRREGALLLAGYVGYVAVRLG